MSKNEIENSKAKEARAEAARAAAALKRGEVIVFPTETLYGLGADALNPAAVDRVFQLKGRQANNPIPVLIGDRRMLLRLAACVPPVAEILMERFWPGPLTIVLPARDDVPRPLVNVRGGIGLRISSSRIAADLLQAFGHPITATSANPSGQPPARTVRQARKYFSGRLEVFIDGGALQSRAGSTVVEIRGDRLTIVRAGEIDRPQLEKAVGTEAIEA